MYLLNILQYFFHSLTKLNNFCVIGCANWRITNDTKIGCGSSLVWAPYFRHLEFCFEWFKTWWVCQVKFYKTSLNSRSKDAMIKDFKLKILIYFDSPLYEHWTLYTKHSTSFLIPFSIWAIFTMLEALGRIYKCSLSYPSKGTMCEDSTSFEFLNVLSLAYLSHICILFHDHKKERKTCN
jgi:hypothetical protein